MRSRTDDVAEALLSRLFARPPIKHPAAPRSRPVVSVHYTENSEITASSPRGRPGFRLVALSPSILSPLLSTARLTIATSRRNRPHAETPRLRSVRRTFLFSRSLYSRAIKDDSETTLWAHKRERYRPGPVQCTRGHS